MNFFVLNKNISLSPGNNYYIDNNTGSDSASGLSNDTAWSTVNKVNGMTQNPGDAFLFKRGGMWREQLNVNGSGNSTNNITFAAYGDGSEKPIINGANLITGWYANGTNLWNASVTSSTTQVFFDGVRGSPSAINQINDVNEWNWSGNQLVVYSTSDPDTAFISPGIEVSIRSLGVSILGKSYIVVDGIHTTKTNNVGIQAYNASGSCDDIILYNVTSSYNIGHGILSTNGDTTSTNDRGRIEYATTYSNGGSGIQISSRTNNTIVRYATSYGNGFAIAQGTGIGSYNASNLLIEYSTSHSNYGNLSGSGAGVYFDVFGENCTVRYSVAYNNSKNGFIAEQGVGINMYYNMAYNNSQSGFSIYGSDNRSGVHNSSIYNNVAVRNLYGIWVHGDYEHINGSVTGNILRNNIAVNNSNKQLYAENGGEDDGVMGFNNTYSNNAFGIQSSGFIGWGNVTTFNNYTSWDLNYGNNSNSITSYPLFSDYSGSDFRLSSSSPGIDGGVFVNLTFDRLGVYVPQGNAVDVGAFEFVNLTYSNFDGDSTNLSNISTSNITNFVIEKRTYGKINFSSTINLSNGADINTGVNVSSNRIEINSTLLPSLNKSAVLTLYNLNYSNPRVLRDGSACQTTCSEISYSVGNFSFSVNSFSVYSADETPTSSTGTTGSGSSGVSSSGSSVNNTSNTTANATNSPIFDSQIINSNNNSTNAEKEADTATKIIYIILILLVGFGIVVVMFLIWYLFYHAKS